MVSDLIFRSLLQNLIFSGGMKNQYIEVELPKKGGLGQFGDLREGLAKKRG